MDALASNVASYTLTIEQTGGSGITVPGLRLPAQQRAHRLQLHPADAGCPGPEPARSGQAAAVLDEPDDPARRRQAVPRGRLARRRHDHHVGVARRSSATSTAHLSLVDAIAAPRLSSRNGASEGAEPAILDGPTGAALTAMGHTLGLRGHAQRDRRRDRDPQPRSRRVPGGRRDRPAVAVARRWWSTPR